MRFRIALVSSALVFGLTATAAHADLQYEAKNVGQCASIAQRSAAEIFDARKLKLDQMYYSERLRRVWTERAGYAQELEALRRAITADQAQAEATCRRHFATNMSSWLLSWGYNNGFRYGSGRW